MEAHCKLSEVYSVHTYIGNRRKMSGNPIIYKFMAMLQENKFNNISKVQKIVVSYPCLVKDAFYKTE